MKSLKSFNALQSKRPEVTLETKKTLSNSKGFMLLTQETKPERKFQETKKSIEKVVYGQMYYDETKRVEGDDSEYEMINVEEHDSDREGQKGAIFFSTLVSSIPA